MSLKRDPASGWYMFFRDDGKVEGEQNPVAVCSRCQRRYAEDLNRNEFGERLLAHEQPRGPIDPVCDLCELEEEIETREERTKEFIEKRLGLSEDNAEALKSVIDLAENPRNYEALKAVVRLVDDPDRLVQIAEVHSRVDEIQRRLDDRTESLRREFSSKITAYSVALDVALVIAGFLGGLAVALLF